MDLDFLRPISNEHGGYRTRSSMCLVLIILCYECVVDGCME